MKREKFINKLSEIISQNEVSFLGWDETRKYYKIGPLVFTKEFRLLSIGYSFLNFRGNYIKLSKSEEAALGRQADLKINGEQTQEEIIEELLNW